MCNIYAAAGANYLAAFCAGFWVNKIEYNIGNGQISDVTGSAHVMGRYLANAIVSDKSK